MRRFPAAARDEFKAFKQLTSPSKVQDFLDTFPVNFELQGDTCRSPLLTLKHKEAHCMEGALVAAAAFWYHGAPPLLLDLKTTKKDESHVVALFKQGDTWGAVSKTNHAVLRYRDPIYKTVRELALSYFNEYFTDDGVKTLRSFLGPFSLLQYENDWLTSPEDLWGLVSDVDTAPHANILTNAEVKNLRRADTIERIAGKLVEWRKGGRLTGTRRGRRRSS